MQLYRKCSISVKERHQSWWIMFYSDEEDEVSLSDLWSWKQEPVVEEVIDEEKQAERKTTRKRIKKRLLTM